MEATVVKINPTRAMCAASIEGSGDFVIFEVLDSSLPQVGDLISHPDFTAMGGETYRNLTSGDDVDVYAQNICGASLVRSQLLL